MLKPFVILFCALIFFVSHGSSQITTYYIHDLDTVQSKEQANEIAHVESLHGTGYNKTIRLYYLNDTLKSIQYFQDTTKVLTWKTFYNTGQLKEEVNWVNNAVETRKTYWPKGTLKRSERYEQDVMKDGQCYSASGNKMTFYPYEEMPEYVGGEDAMYRFLAKNIKVPKAFMEKGSAGKVVIRFVVDEVGKISNPVVVRQHMKETEDETIRVIMSMPSWKPGKQDGIPVKVYYTLPVMYELSE